MKNNLQSTADLKTSAPTVDLTSDPPPTDTTPDLITSAPTLDPTSDPTTTGTTLEPTANPTTFAATVYTTSEVQSKDESNSSSFGDGMFSKSVSHGSIFGDRLDSSQESAVEMKKNKEQQKVTFSVVAINENSEDEKNKIRSISFSKTNTNFDNIKKTSLINEIENASGVTLYENKRSYKTLGTFNTQTDESGDMQRFLEDVHSVKEDVEINEYVEECIYINKRIAKCILCIIFPVANILFCLNSPYENGCEHEKYCHEKHYLLLRPLMLLGIAEIATYTLLDAFASAYWGKNMQIILIGGIISLVFFCTYCTYQHFYICGCPYYGAGEMLIANLFTLFALSAISLIGILLTLLRLGVARSNWCCCIRFRTKKEGRRKSPTSIEGFNFDSTDLTKTNSFSNSHSSGR